MKNILRRFALTLYYIVGFPLMCVLAFGGVISRPFTLYLSWLVYGRGNKFKVYEYVIFMYVRIADFIKPKENWRCRLSMGMLAEAMKRYDGYGLEFHLIDSKGVREFKICPIDDWTVDYINKRIVLNGDEK